MLGRGRRTRWSPPRLSVALERHSQLAMPTPSEHRLLWFVREAWPSPATGTTLTEGQLGEQPLALVVESDRLVAFGDESNPTPSASPGARSSRSASPSSTCDSCAKTNRRHRRNYDWAVWLSTTTDAGRDQLQRYSTVDVRIPARRFDAQRRGHARAHARNTIGMTALCESYSRVVGAGWHTALPQSRCSGKTYA